jgi:hypothetical protein
VDGYTLELLAASSQSEGISDYQLGFQSDRYPTLLIKELKGTVKKLHWPGLTGIYLSERKVNTIWERK